MEDLRIELSQYGEIINCEDYQKYFLVVLYNYSGSIETFNSIANKYLTGQKVCTLENGVLKSEYDWN
jgi:hypothetical protein